MMSTDMKELRKKISNLSDEEITRMLNSSSGVYRDEALTVAKRVQEMRRIPLEAAEEYKVITTGGRENGPFDTSIIRQLYLDELIDKETLIYVQSANQWRPISSVFPIEAVDTGTNPESVNAPASISESGKLREDVKAEKIPNLDTPFGGERQAATSNTGTLFQGTGYMLDEMQIGIVEKIRSNANNALACSIVGFFCLFFLEGFALYYAYRASKLIEEYNVGREYETKIMLARILAGTAIFLFIVSIISKIH